MSPNKPLKVKRPWLTQDKKGKFTPKVDPQRLSHYRQLLKSGHEKRVMAEMILDGYRPAYIHILLKRLMK